MGTLPECYFNLHCILACHCDRRSGGKIKRIWVPHVALFFHLQFLHKVVLTHAVMVEILKCESVKGIGQYICVTTEQYFPELLFIALF